MTDPRLVAIRRDPHCNGRSAARLPMNVAFLIAAVLRHEAAR